MLFEPPRISSCAPRPTDTLPSPVAGAAELAPLPASCPTDTLSSPVVLNLCDVGPIAVFLCPVPSLKAPCPTATL